MGEEVKEEEGKEEEEEKEAEEDYVFLKPMYLFDSLKKFNKIKIIVV